MSQARDTANQVVVKSQMTIITETKIIQAEKVIIKQLYTHFKKRFRRERRMAVVELKLHDRKELWFPYLVCKTNELFAWR